MAWMPSLLGELQAIRPGFRYLGLDVARMVIARNKEAFASQPNWSFGVLDMSTQAVPGSGYDLALTRDALQHLPCRRVVASLKNLAFSGVKYLLIGSYRSSANVDIRTGAYFLINLALPPYGIHPDSVYDERHKEDKLLYFYRASELQKEDFAAMAARCGGNETQ